MNPKGLEIVDLRQINILRHLTDQELAGIKAVHVYGSDRSSFDGPSALYATKNDEVFLAGFDSLVGKSCTEEVPDGRKGILEGSVKVGELSGKSVRKIVVGAEFGAALTTTSDLYLWGCDVGCVPAGLSRLVIECNYDGACCPICSQKLVPYTSRGGDLYLQCNKCGRNALNRVSTIPHPTDWKGQTRTVLGYAATSTAPQIPNLLCLSCGDFKLCYVHLFSHFHIVFCKSCDLVIDGNSHKLPPQTNPAPHKVTFPTSLSIKDKAAGRHFLLVQTSSELFIWGVLGGFRYNHAVKNPDNVVFAEVACGSAHIAVKSDKGDLYTCGVGDKGQLGYTWSATDGHMTLKKVSQKGSAVEVSCGHNSTVCLLLTGSYIIYGQVDKMVSGGALSLNLFDSSLFCLPTVAYQNYAKIVESSMKHLLQYDGKPSAVLTGDLTDMFIHLHGLNVKLPNGAVGKLGAHVHDVSNRTDLNQKKLQDNESQTESELQNSDTLLRLSSNLAHLFGQLLLSDLTLKLADRDFPIHRSDESQTDSELQNSDTSLCSSSNLAHLFGQLLLSDLTLKLADGDFPAHRSVLFSSSAYFSQLFTDSDSPDVLDMSSYNASAYRGLLKYFYGVPLGQMTCQDMFDLYVLATSYKEDRVTADVFSKLKSSIDTNNVLILHDKAKAANATELLKECQTFMNAPDFKKSLWDSLSQDDDIVAELVRLSLSKKS